MIDTKNYIISLNAQMKGSKAVLTGLSSMEGKTKKFKQTVQVAGKSMQTFESRIGGIAKRAIMTVPVWLALRTVMMGLIRTFGDIVKANLDLEEGMARIKTVMQGTSGEIQAGMTAAKGAILDMAVKTKVPIKDLAETFYFLKTANLEINEAMAAFTPTVNAMVGTGVKGKEMARAIAGMYNTMGQFMDDAMTKTEKFTHIADILTYTYATQDVQMGELIAGYEKMAPYVSGLSDDLLTLVTVIGFLNTKMLRGSRTGRLLGRSILQLTKNSNQLAEIFGVTFDPDKPISFLNVLKAVTGAMKNQNKLTAEQGQMLQKVFATRGGVPIRLILPDFEGLVETLELARKNANGFAEAMAEIKMGVTTARAAQLKNILTVLVSDFYEGAWAGGSFASALKSMNKQLGQSRDEVQATGRVMGYLFDQISRTALALETLVRAQPKRGMADWWKAALGMDIVPTLKNYLQSMGDKDIEYKTYAQYIKMVEGERKSAVEYENHVKKLRVDKEALKQKDLATLKEEQAITKHNVNLMKIMKVSALDIARYRLEALEAEQDSMTPEKASLELQKRKSKVYEEQLRFKQTLVNTLQKAEVGMLQALGANDLQILQYKEQQIMANQNIIGQTQTMISLAKIRQQTAIAITKAKEGERLTVSNIYMEYEKADKYEKAKLNRFIEIRKMSAEEIGTTYEMGGFDARVIEEKWSRLAEFQKKAIGKILAEQQGRIITGLTESQLANIERVAPALREAMGESWEDMMPPEGPKIPEGWKFAMVQEIPQNFWVNWLDKGKIAIAAFKEEFGLVGDLGTPPGLYRPPTEGGAPGVPTAVSVPISISNIIVEVDVEKLEESLDEATKKIKNSILEDKQFQKMFGPKL